MMILVLLLAAVPVRPAVLPEPVRTAAARVQWTRASIQKLVYGMPKVETHLHLDGALSPRTIRALAEEQKYAPLMGKSLREIEALAVANKPKDSLAEVLQVFHVVYPLLKTPAAVERMAYEAIASAARQNVRYVEARFAPALQTADGFTAEQVLRSVLRGLKRAEREFGVRNGVIICLIRPFSFVSRETNREMTELAIAYKGRGVVAIDLAGNEAAQPLSDFREFFEAAKAAGLKSTAHAGEAPGSADLETALELGIDRLGHATLLADKPELLEKVKRLGIPIEVNLTSNLRTGATKSIAAHPIKRWLEDGVFVTLSTDDPGVFGIDLNHEYDLLATELNLTPEGILSVAYGGIDALFLPEKDKARLRRRFEADTVRLLKSLAKP